MKPIKKIICILFIYFINTIPTYGNDSIRFINLDFILQNSNDGKSALKKIENLNTKNINTLKEKEKILKDLEKKIASKKNIISKEVFDNEVTLFREKVNKFQNEKDKIIDDFNNFKKNELENVLKKITPIINSYMEKNSIDILLESKNIVMGKKELNLTNEILKELNK